MAMIKCPECGKEISDKAAACPNCGAPIVRQAKAPGIEMQSAPNLSERYRGKDKKKKKKGGKLKWIIIAIVVIFVIAAISGGSDNDSKTASNTTKNDVQPVTEEPAAESETPIEYISVTADELSETLTNNAMKAQNDYENQYLEITGKLGNIDSDGKYISIDTDGFSLTNIQCYIKTEEQKQIIMEMSRGDSITVKGYCKDIGEILGYQIDIDEISK